MDGTRKFKRAFKMIGFNPENGKFGVRFIILYTLLWSLTLNQLFYLRHNWEYMDRRIIAFKTICVFTVIIMGATENVLYWTNMSTILNTIEKGLNNKNPFNKSYESEGRKKLFENYTKEKDDGINYPDYGLKAYLIITPLVIVIKLLIQFGKHGLNVRVEDLTLLNGFYFPEGYKLVSAHIFVLFLQIINRVTVWSIGYTCYAGALNSMKTITYDIKLLNLTLSEMEDKFRNLCHNENYQHEYYLKIYMKYAVREHQNIYRKIQTINQGFTIITLLHTYAISFIICLAVYITAQKFDIMFKLPEVGLSIFLSYLVYNFGLDGEEIITEGENLSSTMYECSLINKPKWYKTTLLIMMIRNNKPMKLQPLGLSVINLEYFSMMMKAVYTYYNVLISFKK